MFYYLISMHLNAFVHDQNQRFYTDTDRYTVGAI
jgi:hypothetical protein